MAKGDDALRKKKNKIIRKKLRNSESSITARVASIIAAKHRRKAGKRRICEGMCFSLPTADDPFNERHAMEKRRRSKKQKLNRRDNRQEKSDENLPEKACCALNPKITVMKKFNENKDCKGEEVGNIVNASVSNFVMLCLKAVNNACTDEGTGFTGDVLSNSWGVNFFRVCSTGSSVVENSGMFATREQIAWVISTAADIVARKEKQGILVAIPFLLFIVPSQDRAIEVRSVCKPLKDLGIHTVSLHPGTSLDHQIHGLKNCEPEFLISTPGRLLDLVSLNAVDISGASLLVIDGLRKFVDLGLMGNLKSIRERLSADPQIISFGDYNGEKEATKLLQNLISEPAYCLSADKSAANESAFASQ